jgi:hypothetical protein
MSSGSTPQRRWYDKEPVLAKALDELRHASTSYQAQVSLNIMKVIVEHRTEAALQEPAENLEQTLTANPNATQRRRWYDTDQTLQAAMQLLQDTPEDLQTTLLPNIAQMIEDALSKNLQTVS